MAAAGERRRRGRASRTTATRSRWRARPATGGSRREALDQPRVRGEGVRPRARGRAPRRGAGDRRASSTTSRSRCRILSRLSLRALEPARPRGRRGDGRACAAPGRASTGDDHERARAIDALKLAALQLGELDRLEALTAELEEIERRHGELWYLQWTLLESSFVPLGRRAAGTRRRPGWTRRSPIGRADRRLVLPGR